MMMLEYLLLTRKKCGCFPYKFNRKNDEIKRLWSFFKSALNNTITDEQFTDILKIKNTGKIKLTEALFYVDPNRYLPINGPTIPFLKDVLKINTDFKNYSDYVDILKKVKETSDQSFYQISYEAWLQKTKNCNYWIFQCNPNMFDLVTALDENLVETWTVSAHKDKIKEGDRAIIWVTGDEAGCYALAEILGEPAQIPIAKDDHLWKNNHKTELRVRISVTHDFSDRPIYKSQIADIKSLSGFKGGNQGTNFQSSKEEYDTFLSLSQDHQGVRYWLYSPGENAAKWKDFYNEGIMGLGWDKIGDLKQYKNRSEIRNALVNAYGGEGSKMNDVSANDDFVNKMSSGDFVIVKKGRGELLGYGIVTQITTLTKKIDYKSCRKIDWKLNGIWKVDFSLVLKTLTDITTYLSEHPDYNKYHERLMGIMMQNSKTKNTNLMSFPLNTIFYGPPGTGKTYQTIKRAAEIITGRSLDDYNEALRIFNEHLGTRIEFITFHQNYSYEDFIQGLRPDTENGNQLTFQKKDGIFKKIADKALENLRLSEKAPSELTNEAQFNIALDTFKDVILEKEDNFPINDSAYILEVEEDAFRYTGEKWTNHTNGLRMKFSDLREFYRNKVASRKDIQKLTSISGLASQHATYYFLVYEQIIKYLPKEIESPQKVEKQIMSSSLMKSTGPISHEYLVN
ncbi:MAG: EVE domain-containing protein [Saprospiraceae bacterium]|nr:EVE domain-containing protein [Saprospiraceae bacterium]